MKIGTFLIALSCADCPSPFVAVYDMKFNLKKSVTVAKQTLEHYNLEINEMDTQSFNLFYSSRTSLSVI
jgi:translation initiation factor 2B subunit (eIF-2B alpha/beta/delta family)